MYYSSFGILSLVLHLLVNYDTLKKPKTQEMQPMGKDYRFFLYSVTGYYVVDILWGLLYDWHIIPLVYTDTVLYFLFMAFTVLFWSRFAVFYLGRKNQFGKILAFAGRLILFFELAALAINFFYPFFFSYDADKVYHPGQGRYITLGLQVLLFLLTAAYTLYITTKTTGETRRHHRIIGFSGIVMALFVILQALDAFVPYYAIGCLVISCLVHKFVTEDEISKYRTEIESAAQKEKILIANRYDYLTGLPNLSWFFEQADAAKTELLREGRHAVLLYVDLNGMKSYNHQYGFEAGNQLLLAFAGILSEIFGREQCSHIGADRFAAFTKEESLEKQLSDLFLKAGQINGGKTLPVLAGVYSSRIEVLPVSSAYDRAKMACNELRKSDVSCWNYYSEEMHDKVRKRQYIQANIDRAISEKWIQVYYQPIIRAVNKKVCDEEALARWIDPSEGFLSPAEFIPHLESSGLIYKLDLYMLDQVLENIRIKLSNGMAIVPCSINLSRSDFNSCNIVEEIRSRVDAAGISRSKITIEITESVIGSDFDFMKEQVERFRKLGFPVWMDDFGNGYSSLDVLQSIQFDLIKFDMSFMRKLDEGDTGKIILTELMKMATALGVETVCEGVETEEQLRFLQDIGCSKLQGYYFCKPIPFDQVLERNRSGARFGYENPDESAYYKTIGRVNLYDLAMVAAENANTFQNAFTTLPMGIIEIRGNSTRFVRYNPSYRDFIHRFFGIELSEMREFVQYNTTFMRNVARNCVEQGNLSVFDEKMPDGSVVHSFARRISVNPVTGDIAIAIAVLSVSDPGEGDSYADIARALAADYYNIYVVDLDTEQFIEYSSAVGKDDLAIERHGTDFFAAAQRDTMTRIFDEDREFFLTWFTKENVIKELDEQGVFTTTYRLIDTGSPVFVNMKITRLQGGNRIILGVSIIDSQMKQQQLVESAKKERNMLAKVMAMSEDYLSLYSVDPATGKYTEYTATEDYKSLGFEQEGEDFFLCGIEDGKRTVYPEDLPGYLHDFTRENVLNEVEKNGLFRIHYRLVIHGEPRQVSLKIVPYSDSEGKKLLAGVRSWTSDS